MEFRPDNPCDRIWPVLGSQEHWVPLGWGSVARRGRASGSLGKYLLPVVVGRLVPLSFQPLSHLPEHLVSGFQAAVLPDFAHAIRRLEV